MYGFDTSVEETVFYKEVLAEGIELGKKKAERKVKTRVYKRAVIAFKVQMEDLFTLGSITKSDYKQRTSAFHAQLYGNRGKA